MSDRSAASSNAYNTRVVSGIAGAQTIAGSFGESMGGEQTKVPILMFVVTDYLRLSTMCRTQSLMSVYCSSRQEVRGAPTASAIAIAVALHPWPFASVTLWAERLPQHTCKCFRTHRWISVEEWMREPDRR